MSSKKTFGFILLSFAFLFFTSSCKQRGTSSATENLDNSKAAEPTVSYIATVANGATSVTATITAAANGTTIHYTTDGTTPTASSPVYTGPITVTGDKDTVKIAAIAIKDGMSDSDIATVAYGNNAGKTNEPKKENPTIKTRYETVNGTVYKISYIADPLNSTDRPFNGGKHSCSSTCSGAHGNCSSTGCNCFGEGCTTCDGFECMGESCTGSCSNNSNDIGGDSSL
ncbi:MAG: chitobiase/beta-hexosaminidase C-terminal domain-containing protein [Proteobacteria bacterium]|nr:chitobiase/beta-hexosaminidase C-terminal domain-containing protein [Pseudomonadota bacterium]